MQASKSTPEEPGSSRMTQNNSMPASTNSAGAPPVKSSAPPVAHASSLQKQNAAGALTTDAAPSIPSASLNDRPFSASPSHVPARPPHLTSSTTPVAVGDGARQREGFVVPVWLTESKKAAVVSTPTSGHFASETLQAQPKAASQPLRSPNQAAPSLSEKRSSHSKPANNTNPQPRFDAQKPGVGRVGGAGQPLLLQPAWLHQPPRGANFAAPDSFSAKAQFQGRPPPAGPPPVPSLHQVCSNAASGGRDAKYAPTASRSVPASLLPPPPPLPRPLPLPLPRPPQHREQLPTGFAGASPKDANLQSSSGYSNPTSKLSLTSNLEGVPPVPPPRIPPGPPPLSQQRHFPTRSMPQQHPGALPPPPQESASKGTVGVSGQPMGPRPPPGLPPHMRNRQPPSPSSPPGFSFSSNLVGIGPGQQCSVQKDSKQGGPSAAAQVDYQSKPQSWY